MGQKAAGPDQVPTELLQSMCCQDSGLEGMTTFFNSILRSGDVPADWDASVTALFPRVLLPIGLKDLRRAS